uniref:Egg protein C122-like n=1 Tax=Schistosoma mansoni TaxID=6183 RepID=A0A3Q0KE31_SCHMA
MMKNSWLLSAIIAVSAVFVQSDDLSYTVPKDLAEYVYFDKCYKIAEQTAVVKNDNQPIKNEPIVEPTVAVNTGSEVISDTQSKSEQLKVTESNPIITNQERIITGNTNTAQLNKVMNLRMHKRVYALQRMRHFTSKFSQCLGNINHIC